MSTSNGGKVQALRARFGGRPLGESLRVAHPLCIGAQRHSLRDRVFGFHRNSAAVRRKIQDRTDLGACGHGARGKLGHRRVFGPCLSAAAAVQHPRGAFSGALDGCLVHERSHAQDVQGLCQGRARRRTPRRSSLLSREPREEYEGQDLGELHGGSGDATYRPFALPWRRYAPTCRSLRFSAAAHRITPTISLSADFIGRPAPAPCPCWNAMTRCATGWIGASICMAASRATRESSRCSSEVRTPPPAPNGNGEQQQTSDNHRIVADPRVRGESRHGLHAGAQHVLLELRQARDDLALRGRSPP